jgi:methylphosphotriester-DNA--protein-cysteine methyltransferase
MGWVAVGVRRCPGHDVATRHPDGHVQGHRSLRARHAVQGRTLRRMVRQCRGDHRYLLSPELPGSPLPKNQRFYLSAAAAQQAGFRACKRCRPDVSPGSPQRNLRSDLVARAMWLIADGVVHRDGVTGLASRLGYSVRQIQRELTAEMGAGPLALARAQRAQTARVLIETSPLAMTDVAFAAGFASIRSFQRHGAGGLSPLTDGASLGSQTSCRQATHRRYF